MQHLIKVNLIVYAAAIAAGMASLLLLGADPTAAFATATKVASVIQLISLAFIYFAWRFIPGYSFFIFPNLGGEWTGHVVFTTANGEREIKADLHIDQNVATISLVLTTEMAESETMVVYPRKLSNFRHELLYVYETHKKETLPPPSYRYRGTAIIRLAQGNNKLAGSYYTEQGGTGTVTFTRKRGKS
ncbi:hypothetical protein [Rhodopseudomonas pseudopalustris]|uniref:CD-NTase-associated protein 15 domain-containing protein n=1 Tax=Rhodopseudomonas pseudopalustris TaxID=1513892 RepID=A0A1H8XBB6_9BRAD|nr:hypothetical protein [Rhodopseudomonas pseudopalustris]SEP37027.1 hypothetical protein SAMN05444123_11854 [Rhodopseudomonas pseudopalustris]